MIHICFAYIFKYKALRGISLKIDSRYDYIFDPQSRQLTIGENKSFPNYFWGKGIYSLAAIVGNNGAGKSLSMEFILNTLVDGANTREVDGVLVYEQDGRLLIWGKDVLVNTQFRYSVASSIPKISCFYYSGHFVPFVDYNDLRSTELAGCYNASDGWLLVKDLQSYSGINSMLMHHSLHQHLYAFVAQNNYRICMMLADEKVRNTVKAFCLPKYVQIGINQSGLFALEEDIRIAENASRQGKYPIEAKIKEIPEANFTHKDLRNRYLEQFIFYNFLSLMNEGLREDPEKIRDSLMAWQSFKNDDTPILNQFETYIKQYGRGQGLEVDLMAILNVLTRIDALCSFFNNGVMRTYYLDTEKDGEKLLILAEEVLGKQFYLAGKFFDMYYSQELGMEAILSSGEQNLLDIFSRLYDALLISPKQFANINSKRLILLDEAEIGFHPDWQRRYINLVLDFLRSMVAVKPEENFQVLISTHSPVLLSDLPQCCVNYLELGDDGVTHNVSEMPDRETFAANVFEQYRDSFLMSKGLIGEYARKKLKAVLDAIEEEQVTDETMMIVRMIGDKRIKDYLLRRISRVDIDKQIAYHEEIIKRLKREKERELRGE